jgi:hypothetical protein
MKMEQIEYSETSAYKIQTPENYPEENIQQMKQSFVWTTFSETEKRILLFPPESVLTVYRMFHSVTVCRASL